MKKSIFRKMSSLLLVLTLLATMTFSGCSNEASNDSEPTTAPTDAAASTNVTTGAEEAGTGDAIDTSEEVHLVGYLLGGAPAGMDKVVEALNVKLKKDINATVEFRYLDWGDYTTKYPLVLATGDDVDFIFTADWCMYNTEAPKNAFREITMEEIQKYMPRHFKNCDPIAYDMAKKNGKIYMITTSTPDVRCSMMAYRKDLADKYGVTGLNKLSDFTAYFKAIAENETDTLPMYLSNSYDTPYMGLANEAANEINYTFGLCYGTEDTTIKLQPLFDEPYLSALKTSWSLMKSWYDAGYVNKDILSNTITSRESFMEGKSAIAFGNSVDMQSVLATATDKGYQVGLVPLLDAQGKTMAVSYLNNGIAIAANCKNPERTMMLLDLLMEEPEYNNLAYFGIEGQNYVVTADNKIGLPDGVTSDTNTYPPDASGLWFLNKDQHLPLASWSDDYIALKGKIPNMLYNQKFAAFAPDLTNIQTETATITNVLQQYQWPLNVGMVDNVDAAIATLKKKLMDAGIEKVQTEIQAQADAYLGQ